MKAAQSSKRYFDKTKLLAIEGGKVEHSNLGEISSWFNSGDILVVNSSATLPSSFFGKVERTGEPIEIRLAAFQGPNPLELKNWLAISFDEGDWRMPTEKRGPPPRLIPTDKIIFGEDLSAEIIEVLHERILRVSFVGKNFEHSLYKHGKPIQYSYLKEELKIWDQQTLFSGPPISVESPSASFNFSWQNIFKLKNKNVEVVDILHGAGISSAGSEILDKLLPLEEFYQISSETALKVNNALKEKRRIIAMGTTVVRALESAFKNGFAQEGKGLTKLKITPQHQLKVVSTLITGMHEVGTSHLQILNSFISDETIKRAYDEAEMRGYRGHEYGDVSLISMFNGVGS